MKRGNFCFGGTFWLGDRKWRCTDIGTRVIVAICIDEVRVGGPNFVNSCYLTAADAETAGWFNGPPYAVVERVFDEYDQVACSPTPARP